MSNSFSAKLLKEARNLSDRSTHLGLRLLQQGIRRDPSLPVIANQLVRRYVLLTVLIQIRTQLAEMMVGTLSCCCGNSKLANCLNGGRKAVESKPQIADTELLSRSVISDAIRITTSLQPIKRPGQRLLCGPEFWQHHKSSVPRGCCIRRFSVAKRSVVQPDTHHDGGKRTTSTYPRCPKFSFHVAAFSFPSMDGSYSIPAEIAHG